LATQALSEKQLDLQGGLEMMPEARPDQVEGAGLTTGVSGRLSYGFSDRFTMGLHAWGEVENRLGNFRGGYALQAQIYYPVSPGQQFIFIPKVGMVLNASTISGYGLEGALVYQKLFNPRFSAYAGGGLAVGIHELEKQQNIENELKIPMGMALIGHLGLSWQLTVHLRLNAEVHPIYQINSFDEVQHFLLSPHIGIGYTLGFE
jgi:hypothetical protein